MPETRAGTGANEMGCVIVCGDPLRGIKIYGPFESREAASEQAEKDMPNETWWIAPLETSGGEQDPYPFVVALEFTRMPTMEEAATLLNNVTDAVPMPLIFDMVRTTTGIPDEWPEDFDLRDEDQVITPED